MASIKARMAAFQQADGVSPVRSSDNSPSKTKYGGSSISTGGKKTEATATPTTPTTTPTTTRTPTSSSSSSLKSKMAAFKPSSSLSPASNTPNTSARSWSPSKASGSPFLKTTSTSGGSTSTNTNTPGSSSRSKPTKTSGSPVKARLAAMENDISSPSLNTTNSTPSAPRSYSPPSKSRVSSPNKFNTSRINSASTGMTTPTPSKLAITCSPNKSRASRPPVAKKIDLAAKPKSSSVQQNPEPIAQKEKINLTKDAFHDTKSQQQENQTERGKNAAIAPQYDEATLDWDFLYELAVHYDNFKLQENEEIRAAATATEKTKSDDPSTKKFEQGDKKNLKATLEGVIGGNYAANGNWLNDEFFDQYLVDCERHDALTLDFGGQNKLFKRFDRKDDEREHIIVKFVDALLTHPRSKDITSLNMPNALIPGAFIAQLAKRCMEENGLPNLRVMNLESNLLDEEGLVGISQAIADPNTWPCLQVLKLENQKRPFTDDAEAIFGNAVLKSNSLAVVSIRIRDGLARQQVNNTVAANVDNLRLARRKHKSKMGTLQERKRNDMEQYFDRIAQDDPTITEVDLVGDIKFLGLNPTERTKTGAAFATNTHVKSIKMVKLGLDDDFAAAMGQALQENSTLEKILIDSNAISGDGMKALLAGLGQNTGVQEFSARHQSKTTSSADEQALDELIEPNQTLTKLGLDLRDPLVKMQLDRKCNTNREHQRKLRAPQRKSLD